MGAEQRLHQFNLLVLEGVGGVHMDNVMRIDRKTFLHFYMI